MECRKRWMVIFMMLQDTRAVIGRNNYDAVWLHIKGGKGGGRGLYDVVLIFDAAKRNLMIIHRQH